MTGIGMVNATHTTEVALDSFHARAPEFPSAQWFSRVSRVDPDVRRSVRVAVPARWTADDGDNLAGGRSPKCSPRPMHSRSTWRAPPPWEILVCTLQIPSPASRSIDLKREPQLFVGGDGSSDDHNNGVAFPAIPFAGSIFGPQPCTAPDRSPLFTGNFFQAIGPFLVHGLLSKPDWHLDGRATRTWMPSIRRPRPRNKSPMRTVSRSSASAACPTAPATR